ncbi:transposase [Mesorhizobium sp.]|uniref:transposase n=1 Tax=Mesorhizobium sp. TaxID=1871066 RepID=UPI00338DC0E4
MPSAVACFMDDFEAAITHLRMPITHRRAIRTTNLLERLFVEERRRLIPNAFGEKPVLKLMFGAMIRAAERWRAIRITDFERRQMTVVRQGTRSGIRGPKRPRQESSGKGAPPEFIQQFPDLTVTGKGHDFPLGQEAGDH